MEQKEKIIQLYSNRKHELDVEFHLSLLKAVRQLNLHEWEARLEAETHIAQRIIELSDLSSKRSQEDSDDAELLSYMREIKDLIRKKDIGFAQIVIRECQDLKWESYSSKVSILLAGKPNFEKIVERIRNTVHSDQLKIDSILFTALFYCVNGEKIEKYLHIYSTMIEVFSVYLQSNEAKLQAIDEASTYSNVCQLEKVKYFTIFQFLVLRVCLRFCEIIKILAGRNNLSLKFTAIRKQIQKLMKNYSEVIIEEKEDVFSVIDFLKDHLKCRGKLEKSKICRWCFRMMEGEVYEHAFCRYLIENRTKFLIK